MVEICAISVFVIGRLKRGGSNRGAEDCKEGCFCKGHAEKGREDHKEINEEDWKENRKEVMSL